MRDIDIKKFQKLFTRWNRACVAEGRARTALEKFRLQLAVGCKHPRRFVARELCLICRKTVKPWTAPP